MTAHGSDGSAARPQSSPLMKLPILTRTEAQWHQRYNKVGNPQKRLPSCAREQRHRDDHADDAAVGGHPAFPDCENLERMLEVIRQGSVEQHMAQAAADNRADHSIEQQVVDVLWTHVAPRLARAQLAKHEEQHESDQVHQPVPANRERADRKCDWV